MAHRAIPQKQAQSRSNLVRAVRPAAPQATRLEDLVELNTPAQRWRFRRDLVICLAHRQNGLSQRFLADVFDLPRSRIGEIMKQFEARLAELGHEIPACLNSDPSSNPSTNKPAS